VPAAAVALTRGSGGELELFLVQRAFSLKVFPGFWALPGGGLEPLDGDPSDGTLQAFRRAAARELFEETGVLAPGLARAVERQGLDARELRAGLTAAEADSQSAAARLAEQRWGGLWGADSLEPSDMDPICWTVTPRFAHKRFRALYVHQELPRGARAEIVPGELINGRWVRPGELWKEWLAGGLDLVPPLVFLLEQLALTGGDLERAFAAAEARSLAIDSGALHVVAPAPGVLLAPLRTATLPPATSTNCVCIGTDQRYVIDPASGDPGEIERLLEALAPGPAVRGIIATHHHPDHVGGVATLSEALGVPVWAHPLTLARLPAAPRDPRPLIDGQTLPLGVTPDGGGPWELEALHTPGHDRGHLCLFERRYRTLVAGDLVSTLSTIVIEPPEGHLATYLAQLARVLALEPRRLIPAHGAPAADGCALLEVFLRHREQRERQLLAALAQTAPAGAEALLARVYADVPTRLWPFARGSLWAGLHKLLEERRVVFEGAEPPPLASSRARLPDGRWSLAVQSTA
jgi:glyoxylase-like metal-dependent hydrolase (beta-lactamase superfamily II)/8-oxo-dGTP pyrophosphatase MutT (NUDIX family)